MDWSHYAPHLPELIDDPFPAYVWLREHSPVHYVESEDIWCLSRYDDIAAAVRDDAVFSNTQGVGYSRDEGGLALTNIDRPHHTRLRRQMLNYFSRGSVGLHKARAEQLINQLIDGIIEQPGANLAQSISMPFLATLVAEWMGIPPTDIKFVNDGATASSLVMAGDFSEGPLKARACFARYFDAMAIQEEAAKEAGAFCPGQLRTLSDALFTPTPDGYELTHAESTQMLALLAVGGNETTAQFLSAVAHFLSEREDVFETLRADRSLVPAACEELLRYLSPVQGLFRNTREETRIHGRTIPANSKILLLYASGNHDPSHYDAPGEFRLNRFPRGVGDADHLSFTEGVHKCLGAHLARLMIITFINGLCDRVKRIEMTGPVGRSHNALVRCIEDLPVHLHAA
ncbi:MAG: cytochrome P450 [Sphingomonadales bacterium]